MKQYKRVLFPGRFQPFHNGHLHAIKYILTKSEEVIVGVMAAQYNFTLQDPFTAGERIQMIHDSLKNLNINVYIVPLNNIPNNSLWIEYLKNYLPSFEAVFTNNAFVKLLCEKSSVKVEPIPFKQRKKLNGEKIRELMVKQGNWEKLLPSEAVKIIKQVNGVKRLKTLYAVGASELSKVKLST